MVLDSGKCILGYFAQKTQKSGKKYLMSLGPKKWPKPNERAELAQNWGKIGLIMPETLFNFFSIHFSPAGDTQELE